MYECAITLRPDARSLADFLSYISRQSLPIFMTFAAVAWPFPEIEKRTLRMCKFAVDGTNYEDDFQKVLIKGGYGYYDSEPLWRPAEIVNLSFPGKVRAFFKEREQSGFRVCSTVGAWPRTSDWRFALGFSDPQSRDDAMKLLSRIQEAERVKALARLNLTGLGTQIADRFQLSSREVYDVLEGHDGAASSSITAILGKIDTGNFSAVRPEPWVYHAGVTDWSDIRHIRLFTYVHDPGISERNDDTDAITRQKFEDNSVAYTTQYIVRMMACRDQYSEDWESLNAVYESVLLLEANGIYLDSVQTVVPPKMEAQELPTLYSVTPDQEKALEYNPIF